jgi:hypothetical protein
MFNFLFLYNFFEWKLRSLILDLSSNITIHCIDIPQNLLYQSITNFDKRNFDFQSLQYFLIAVLFSFFKTYALFRNVLVVCEQFGIFIDFSVTDLWCRTYIVQLQLFKISLKLFHYIECSLYWKEGIFCFYCSSARSITVRSSWLIIFTPSLIFYQHVPSVTERRGGTLWLWL